MALCPKCFISGVVQGTSRSEADTEADRFGLDLEVKPDSDGEFEGTREVAFEGEVVDRSDEHGASVRGLLVGNFDVDPDTRVEAHATVETFSRGGALGLIQLTVRDDDGRLTLRFSLEPTRDGDLSGVAFLGHQRGTITSS